MFIRMCSHNITLPYFLAYSFNPTKECGAWVLCWYREISKKGPGLSVRCSFVFEVVLLSSHAMGVCLTAWPVFPDSPVLISELCLFFFFPFSVLRAPHLLFHSLFHSSSTIKASCFYGWCVCSIHISLLHQRLRWKGMLFARIVNSNFCLTGVNAKGPMYRCTELQQIANITEIVCK